MENRIVESVDSTIVKISKYIGTLCEQGFKNETAELTKALAVLITARAGMDIF